MSEKYKIKVIVQIIPYIGMIYLSILNQLQVLKILIIFFKNSFLALLYLHVRESFDYMINSTINALQQVKKI